MFDVLPQILCFNANGTLMGKYVQLTRPRIVAMVLFALAVAAWTSGERASFLAADLSGAGGNGVDYRRLRGSESMVRAAVGCPDGAHAGTPHSVGSGPLRPSLVVGVALSVSGPAVCCRSWQIAG